MALCITVDPLDYIDNLLLSANKRTWPNKRTNLNKSIRKIGPCLLNAHRLGHVRCQPPDPPTQVAETKHRVDFSLHPARFSSVFPDPEKATFHWAWQSNMRTWTSLCSRNSKLLMSVQCSFFFEIVRQSAHYNKCGNALSSQTSKIQYA
jgi:hypothetical protein|uniref:Uncharacterized protein n=1 Tax=Zea mays TaxID=4577 RepID=A0A804RBE4_MAIZE